MTVSNLRHRRGSGATDGATLRCALLVAACLLAGFLVDARAAVASAADLPALDGLDPVRLVEGMEEQGDPLLTATHEGLVYRFASDRTRRAFLAEPERYAVQLAGACARMGPGVEGAPDLFAVHDGRLYLFGTEQCLEAFVEHPERYLLPELPPLEPTTAELKAARELLAKAVPRSASDRCAGAAATGSRARSSAARTRRRSRSGPRRRARCVARAVTVRSRWSKCGTGARGGCAARGERRRCRRRGGKPWCRRRGCSTR
jgi:YHS domain-containing protein